MSGQRGFFDVDERYAALSAAAFGRRMALRESRTLAGSYMGYAVKP